MLVIIRYLCFSVPPLSRDTLFRAYAADCLTELGKVVLVGGSIPQWKGSTGPLRDIGWFHNKVHIKKFHAIVDVHSPNSGKVLFIYFSKLFSNFL